MTPDERQACIDGTCEKCCIWEGRKPSNAPTTPTPEAIEAGAIAAWVASEQPFAWDDPMMSDRMRDQWRRIARAVLEAKESGR